MLIKRKDDEEGEKLMLTHFVKGAWTLDVAFYAKLSG